MTKLEQRIYDLYETNISEIKNKRARLQKLLEFLNIDIDPDAKIGSKISLKQILTLASNLTKPFNNRNQICTIEPEMANAEFKAKINELLINSIWQQCRYSKQHIRNIVTDMILYGTSFVETGWEYKEHKELIYSDSKYKTKIFEEKFKNSNEYEIAINNDKVEIYKKIILKNKPFLKSYNINNVVFDTESDVLTWLFIEFDTTLDELFQKGYSDKVLNKIKRMIKKNIIETEYDLKDLNKIRFKIYKFYEIKNNKTSIYYLVDDNNGFTIVNSVKDIFEGFFPIVNIKLYDIDKKIDGKPLTWAILQEEKFNSSLKKAIIDNLGNSNYNKVFYKKGSLSEAQLKNYLNGKPLIEVNTRGTIREAIEQGNFNPLPQSVFALLDRNDNEASSITGINSIMQGVSSNDIKAPATNFNLMMNQSGIRLEDFISNITDGLKLIFNYWCIMFGEYYTEEDIHKITGINIDDVRKHQLESKIKEFGLDQLSEEDKASVKIFLANEIEAMLNLKDIRYSIEINVASDGLKQMRVQNDLMLIQQLAPLANTGAIGIQHIKMLLADLAENMDKHKLAKDILKYQPQPDQMKQALAEAEIAEKQSKAQKEQALAQNAMARTQMTNVKARKEQVSIDPDVALKYAQVAKTASDAQKDNNVKKSNR